MSSVSLGSLTLDYTFTTMKRKVTYKAHQWEMDTIEIRANDFSWLIDELRDFLFFSELLTIERVLDPKEGKDV